MDYEISVKKTTLHKISIIRMDLIELILNYHAINCFLQQAYYSC